MAKKKAKKPARPRKKDPLPDLPDRRLIERFMWSVLGDNPLDDSPEARAGLLVEQAFAAEEPREQARLARQALQVWPDCADAYVLLAQQAPSAEEAAALYREGVSAGERALGEDAFQQLPGNFWLVLETRPYMRARFGLAQVLWSAGAREEAAGHFGELLRLNPGDNQGARLMLATCLLELGWHDDLQRLLDQYPGDQSATWVYTRALLAFRTEGDSPRSRKLLKKAAKTNRHVPQYLVGNRPMPRSLPQYISPGDEDEAVAFVAEALSTWRDTSGAVSWARETLNLGLPVREESPGHAWSRWKDALLRLPASARETWEVDFREFPGDEDRTPPAPWVVVALNLEGPSLVMLEPQDAKPSADSVWEVLLEAMRDPQEGEPRRPKRIVVSQRSFSNRWRAKLAEIGVECRLQERLEGIDVLFEGLRTQACRFADATPRPDAVPEELGELPQAREEAWQAGVRRMPIWIGQQGRPFRPWGVMVVEAGDGLVLGHDLTNSEPTDDDLWSVLAAAMTAPVTGDPRRPGALEFMPSGPADRLRPRLEAAGIEVRVCGRLPALDAAFDGLIQHVTGGKRETGLVDVPGMRLKQVAGFYEAAAEFYRRAPWRRIPGDTIIRIESPRFQSGPWHAIVMGQSGVTIGLALYDDLDTLRSIIDSPPSDDESFRRTSAVSITFGEAFNIPVADLDTIEEHGWPIAGPEAYPHAIRVNPGFAVRPPLAWELELAEASLRALPGFIEEKASTRSDRIEIDSGPIDLTLSRLG